MTNLSLGKTLTLAAIVASTLFITQKAIAQRIPNSPPAWVSKIKFSDGEKEFFKNLHSSPEAILYRANDLRRYTGVCTALKFTEHAIKYAYEIKNTRMYYDLMSHHQSLKTECTALRKEEKFRADMQFGIFLDTTNQILVYDYLDATLKGTPEDSAALEHSALFNGRGIIFYSARKEYKLTSFHPLGDEKVKLFSQSDKTLFTYQVRGFDKKGTTKKFSKGRNLFHYKIPRNN